MGRLSPALLGLLAACAGFSGRPAPYQDRAAVLKADSPYLGAEVRTDQNAGTQQFRDRVVYARLEVIDLNYDDFEARLMVSGGAINLGSDFATLVLNGLGATTGAAATKAALAAASAGVVGAKGAINTDIFYQKTLPALVAQMRADRAQALVAIVAGLKKPADAYSLGQALYDLNTYYVAGTLPSALSSVTAQAGSQLAAANDELARVRTSSWVAPDKGSSAARILAWLYPGGDETKPVNSANLQALATWMNNDKTDPILARIPYQNLLTGSGLLNAETDRQRAITELKIPEAAR